MRPAARVLRTIALCALGMGVCLWPATASATACAGAPLVHSGAAGKATSSTAILSGGVDPQGCSTSYTFEYGTTASYGRSTTAADAGTGTKSISVHVEVSGLTPATVYHMRIVATNATGTTDGADATFRTPADCSANGTAPAISAGSPTAAQAGEVLRSTVNPEGCSTTYYFEYGPSTSYGSITPSKSAGHGLTPVPASAVVGGLAPNQAYHFRLVATSSVGTADGPDISFTTPVNCRPGGSQPGAVTGAARAVTIDSATLSGTVDTGGCAARYFFEYAIGNGLADDHRTPSVRLPADPGSQAVTATINGLQSGQIYHYTLVVITGAGQSTGTSLAFHTGAAAPRARLQILGRTASLLAHRDVAGLLVSCTTGSGGCRGSIRFVYHGRVIAARHRFRLRSGQTRVIIVRLTDRGKRLMRHRRRVHIVVVGRSSTGVVRQRMTLIRRRGLR